MIARLFAIIDRIEAELTPERRYRLYRIVQLTLAVLGTYHLVGADTTAQVLEALALLFGIAPAQVAARNVPTSVSANVPARRRR